MYVRLDLADKLQTRHLTPFHHLQATAPLASVFIAVQHNATDPESLPSPDTPMTYTYGSRDAAAVFFYCLISIVMHAIIQEYILDVRLCVCARQSYQHPFLIVSILTCIAKFSMVFIFLLYVVFCS